MADQKQAPADRLQSLAAVDSIIAHVAALDTKSYGGGAARRKKEARDVAWAPIVPLGHTAYSWGEDDYDDASEHKLSNVLSQDQAHHEYKGKHHHIVTPAAAVTATATAATTAAASDAKDDKSAKKAEGGKKKGGDSKQPKKDDKQPKKDAAKSESKKGGHKGGAKKTPPPTAAAGTQQPFARLDIRVGKIVHVEKHANAKNLYIEKIDVGEPQPRQILSGLVQFVPLADMQGATVLVCCNLKPVELQGEKSYGMVLAASNDNRKTVELVTPAAGSKAGDRLVLQNATDLTKIAAIDREVDAFEPGNAWIDVKDFLTTDSNGIAQYNGTPLVTTAGPARAKTQSNGKIS
jgi:aminoacyl tRNA synthase complex-interacting multifunctional protein 1